MTHENRAADQPEEARNPTGTVAARCINIVEQYRAETISKGDAIYEFAKAIPAGEDGTTEAPGKTLESYISMLDDWDHERTLSETDEQREEAQNEENNSGAGNKGHKQAERNDKDEYDAECNEPIHRRLKIDPEQFPWSTSDRIEGSALRNKCAATRNLIVNYSLDVKLAKAHLNSGVAPKFPDTEWKSLLSGLAINLDTVFSVRSETLQSQREKQQHLKQSKQPVIGSLPGTKQQQQPPLLSHIGAKNVKNTADTYLTSLPPLQKSTTASSSTMTEPCTNKSCSAETSCSLTSPNLVTCEFNSSTSEAQTLVCKQCQAQSNTSRCLSKQSSDPCLRWNRGVCPSTAERCFYKHICSYCRKPDHVNNACPNKPKTGTDRGQHCQTD